MRKNSKLLTKVMSYICMHAFSRKKITHGNFRKYLSKIPTLRGLFFLVFLTGCDAFSAGGRADAGRGAAELVETEAASSLPLDSLRTLVTRRLNVDEDGDWPGNKIKIKTLRQSRSKRISQLHEKTDKKKK